MRILITGANGMLGEKCIKTLGTQHILIATDLAEEPSDPQILGEHSYQRLDITDRSAIKAILARFAPKIVVNCAAFTDVDGSEDQRELAYAVNVGGVQNFIAELTDESVHFIQISTDYVFDGRNGPYRENDPVNPISYYGWTKLEAEKVLMDAHCRWTIIRTNVLFGQSRYRAASFVDWVIRNLAASKAIRVVNDQFGNPTWADGLAEVIAAVIEQRLTGLYHYGGRDYVNRYEFAQLIAEVFDLDASLIIPITTESLNQKAKRPLRSGLICEKIVQALNIQLYSLRDVLIQMKGTSS